MQVKSVILVSAALLLPLGAAHAQDTGQTVPQEQAQPAETQPAQAQAGATTAAVQLAAKEDIKAGVAVLDPAGEAVGTIESIDAETAVLSTGKVRVAVPFDRFGKSDKGLVIGMTKAEVEAAAKGG